MYTTTEGGNFFIPSDQNQDEDNEEEDKVTDIQDGSYSTQRSCSVGERNTFVELITNIVPHHRYNTIHTSHGNITIYKQRSGKKYKRVAYQPYPTSRNR